MEVMFQYEDRYTEDTEGMAALKGELLEELRSLDLGECTVSHGEIRQAYAEQGLVLCLTVYAATVATVDFIMSHGSEAAEWVRKVVHYARGKVIPRNGRIDSEFAAGLAMDRLGREYEGDFRATLCVNLSIDLETGEKSDPPAALKEVPRALYVQAYHVGGESHLWLFAITSLGEVRVAERLRTGWWVS